MEPDFLCTRGDEVRLVEVKAGMDCVTDFQRGMFDTIEAHLGATVEVIRLARSSEVSKCRAG